MNESGRGMPSCARCGAWLAPGALEGLCPRCLMALNLAAPTDMAAPEAESCGTNSAQLPPEAPPSLTDVAEHFPQLEVLECLGRGGMGIVYKARQRRLNRLVALKILAPERKRTAQFSERFSREALALARLNHPGIVAVYDFGEANGLYYLLMEYVEGVSLRHLLHSHQIAPEEALAIVPKICEALQYAHERGVVHRDIKPENVLLDKEGQVKIADFGVAKMVGGNEGGRALTQDRQVVGTPHYMAPEQVEHPERVDHRADIFSLGVVFYEMLTGELPLGRFPPPSEKVPGDVRLDEVVLRALEKEPERRYQQASQVKSDVETIAMTPLPTSVGTATTHRLPELGPAALNTAESEGCADIQGPDRAAKRAGRARVMAGVLAAALLLGAVSFGRLAWQRLRTGSPPNPVQLKTRLPPRDPQAGRNLIDLTAHYNVALRDTWHDLWGQENHLGELPTGLQTFAGTAFDVRGLILVERASKKYPPKMEHIAVGLVCRRLHFLQAASNAYLFDDGMEIGRYVVHYANGAEQEIPIVLGQDLLDWWKPSDGADQRLVVAWTGENPKSRREGKQVFLFKRTWQNPWPRVPIDSLDFLALRPGPSPFLVALTAE